MKKLCLCLLIILLLFTGCEKPESTQIVATTLPVYEFTTQLCKGTPITVSMLITENVSCLHDYSVQVSQMQNIESAETIILSGAGLEDFLDDALRNHPQKVNAAEGIGCNHNADEHHNTHHHDEDPHLWLSPEKAKQMSVNIAANLSDIYPEYEEQFLANLMELLAKLDALQEYGENTLHDLSCRELITFHDGFSYFAEAFDLHILKAVEEESGSEISAKELVNLSKLITDLNIPAIFTETNGSVASAKALQAEMDVAVYTLDMAMSGGSYFDAMYHNINTIKEALE